MPKVTSDGFCDAAKTLVVASLNMYALHSFVEAQREGAEGQVNHTPFVRQLDLLIETQCWIFHLRLKERSYSSNLINNFTEKDQIALKNSAPVSDSGSKTQRAETLNGL